MDPALLDVLHHARQVELPAVVEGVDVDLGGGVEEAVDEQGGRAAGRPSAFAAAPGEVVAQLFAGVDDLHPAPSQDVGGADEHRVADPVRDARRLSLVRGRAVGGRAQPGLRQDGAEAFAVLGEVDGRGARADDGQALGLEGGGQRQRRLAPQLHDDAGDRPGGGLRPVDLQDVFQREGLEVEACGHVVVGGDRLRVAVDHDGLVVLPQSPGSLHARVVELDPLPDPVGPRTEDEDGGPLPAGDLGLLVVARIVVGGAGREFGGAGVDRLVDGVDSVGPSHLPDRLLPDAADLADLRVGEAVPFGQAERLRAERLAAGEFVGDLVDQADLVDEPGVDPGRLVGLLDAHRPAQGLLEGDEAPLRGRGRGPQEGDGLLAAGRQALPVEGGAALVEGSHGLVEGLGEVPAQGHGLAHRLHRGGQPRVGVGELLEGEARHLHHDVVERGLEARGRRAGDVVGDLVEGVADGQPGRDLGDGEPRGLRGEGRGARDPGVHLDDDDAPRGRVDRELDVAPARVHADLADDRDADVAHPLVLPVGQGQGGRHGDGVAGVHADGVDVLD